MLQNFNYNPSKRSNHSNRFNPFGVLIPIIVNPLQLIELFCYGFPETVLEQVAVIIMLERQVRKNIHKPPAILIIVEDSLTIYPSHHHMVDATAAFLSGTPRHGTYMVLKTILSLSYI